MPNSTTLVVNVGIDLEALRRPRQLVVRRHVTNRAGRTGAAATAGVGTVPWLVWMVRAHPAAIIAEDTSHDKPNRDGYETFQFGTSAAGWKVKPRRNELPLRQIIRFWPLWNQTAINSISTRYNSDALTCMCGLSCVVRERPMILDLLIVSGIAFGAGYAVREMISRRRRRRYSRVRSISLR
jgi:hypothetical protein